MPRLTVRDIRNVALVGHHGAGQDHAGRGPAGRHRRHPPAGLGGEGHHGLRLRARGDRSASCRSRWPSPRSTSTASRSTSSTPPATPTSSADVRSRAGRRRPGGRRGERHRRRPGPDRGRLAGRRRPRPARGWSSSTSSTASEPTSTGRWPRSAGRSGPGSPRSSCRSAPRRRSAASSTCSTTRPPSTTPGARPTGTGRPDPRRAGRPPSTRSTSSWSRASWSATTTSWTRYLDGETIARSELEASAGRRRRRRRRSSRCCAARPSTGVGIDRLARLLVELGPLARPAPPGHRPRRRHHGRGRLRPRRPAARSRVQDALGPTRRADLAVQGAVGHHPARRRPRRTRAPAPTSGCTCSSSCAATTPRPVDEAVAGRLRGRTPPGRRPRRRHPGPQGHPGDRRAPEPEPPPLVGRRAAGLPGRRRQAHVRRSSGSAEEDPAAAVVAGSTRRTRPCSAVAGEVHLAVTLERLARKFGVDVEREDVARPLPRDHHRAGRRRGHATRSSRAATASSGSATCGSSRSAAARVRLPRRGRRRGHPPPVHPGGREGRARGHGPGRRLRLPGRRRRGDRRRRQTPLRSTRRR